MTTYSHIYSENDRLKAEGKLCRQTVGEELCFQFSVTYYVFLFSLID